MSRNSRQQRRVEAELGEIERQHAAIEDAQHHALAVDRGRGRDAEIDLLAAHREPHPPVLRQPPLGDVEPRHDLDAREDGVAQPRRRRLDLAQHAVDAIAHAQPRLGGFEMDVRGAHLHRAGDEAVDQPDHRRLAGEILQPFEIGVAVVVVAFARRLVDALDGGAALAIEPLAGGLDVGGKGRATQHRLAEGEGERARGRGRRADRPSRRRAWPRSRRSAGRAPAAGRLPRTRPAAIGSAGNSAAVSTGEPMIAAYAWARSRSDTRPSLAAM